MVSDKMVIVCVTIRDGDDVGQVLASEEMPKNSYTRAKFAVVESRVYENARCQG